MIPACGLWNFKQGEKHQKIAVVAGQIFLGVSVEFLYLDHHNQYSDGWVTGPVLPAPNSNHRIFQHLHSIVMMTFNSFSTNPELNSVITVLDSPTGSWKLKAPANVGSFFAASLMLPDELVEC